MTEPNMTELVINTIRQVLNDRDKPSDVALNATTNILADTGLDSLGLAEVVVHLEMQTDKFPFADGFVNFQTIGELAVLYEQA